MIVHITELEQLSIRRTTTKGPGTVLLESLETTDTRERATDLNQLIQAPTVQLLARSSPQQSLFSHSTAHQFHPDSQVRPPPTPLHGGTHRRVTILQLRRFASTIVAHSAVTQIEPVISEIEKLPDTCSGYAQAIFPRGCCMVGGLAGFSKNVNRDLFLEKGVGWQAQ